MKKIFISIVIFCYSSLLFAQKFMIFNGDTLPYKVSFEINQVKSFDGNRNIYKVDTIFSYPCESFEIKNRKILNASDDRCLKQGYWEINDSLGNLWTGSYKNGMKEGIWKLFDKKGKLLKEIEEISYDETTYKLKEVVYFNGKQKTIINNPILALLFRNKSFIFILILLMFFIRILINSKIYNFENGTEFSLFFLGIPFTKNYWNHTIHTLLCVFTLCFFKYKPENRTLVFISNTLTTILICSLLIIKIISLIIKNKS